MVYESDFYTTRRPYSRPTVSSYSVTKQDYFPWEKVPFVPRPSLVPEPFTVWGRKKQDPKKEFYQYVTLKDKEGIVRGKNPAKEEHTRQLVDGGAVSKVSLDAATELATKGHVFEKGVLSRQPAAKRHMERPIILPLSTILQLRNVPRMPYVAHKRLVTVIHMPYHTVYHGGSLIPIRVHARVRPSIIAAEINRIHNLTRPSTESYTEKYLQSRDRIYFDDEAREIRARVDSLLRRVHIFVPRAVASDFVEEIVPERMRCGDYVRRLISGKQNAKKDMIEPVSWYEVPDRGNFGNLACVKYVAGKPQSVRKPYFKVADLRPSDIKNDVNFLSYYSKNREAAANASPVVPMTERELRKARALQADSDGTTLRQEVRTERKVESKPEKKRESKREKEEIEKTSILEAVAEPVSVKDTESKQDFANEPEGKQTIPRESETVKEPEPVRQSASARQSKSAKKSKSVKESKPVEVSQMDAEPVKEPEPAKKPEPAKEPEPVIEPEPQKEVEPAKEPEAVEEPEPVTEPEAVEEPEPVTEPENVPEPIEESQPVAEAAEKSQSEVVSESAPATGPEIEQESALEASSEAQAAEAVSESEETGERETRNKDVRQDKEEAAKRIEQYLIKAAEEARSDEERRQAAEEELVKLEVDESKAWEAFQVAQERAEHLDEILEQENAEAERKAEEAKIEAARLETERILAEEKLIAEAKTAALLEAQERMIVEEQIEKTRVKEETEERLANVTFDDVDEVKDIDHSRDDVITCDDIISSDSITTQEREERPYEPFADDDTRIEEENVHEEEHFEMTEDPFVEEPEGAESKNEGGANAVEESAKVEDVTSGGEESFEWGDDDA